MELVYIHWYLHSYMCIALCIQTVVMHQYANNSVETSALCTVTFCMPVPHFSSVLYILVGWWMIQFDWRNTRGGVHTVHEGGQEFQVMWVHYNLNLLLTPHDLLKLVVHSPNFTTFATVGKIAILCCFDLNIYTLNCFPLSQKFLLKSTVIL